MRYLRMLSNSVFGGLLAAAYLTLLVLHLNPAVPLTPRAVVPLLTVFALSYGLHIAFALYAIYVLRQIVMLEPSSPGWISLRLLTWSGTALGGAVAVIAWLNLRGLRLSLEARALDTLPRFVAVMGVVSAAFLLLAVTHAVLRRRGRAIVAPAYVVIVVASIGIPLALRGAAIERPLEARSLEIGEATPAAAGAPRAVVLFLDGASLDVISPAVAGGRLPNVGRLLDAGASMHLATTRPTQPEPVWASVATGKWPARHGVRSAALYRSYGAGATLDVLPDYLFSQALVRFGFIGEASHSSSTMRSRPLWRILTAYGVPAGVIGVPLTHPAEPVHGFIVSDRFYRRLDPAVELDERPAFYPPDIEELAREVLNGDEAVGPPAVPARMAGAVELLPQTEASGSDVFADQIHHRLAMRLGRARDVRVLAVRYPGLDAVGHYYLRYAAPADFGDVSDDERRRFGRVLDDYYAYVDGLVGDALALLREGDLLLVVSGFGMEALTPGKRLLERIAGNPRFSGTHERAPDGFLLAYGSAVAPGRLTRGAIVDVTPTLLYFLGLPVGRDMDGFARTDIFTRSFNARRTITFIPTHDR